MTFCNNLMRLPFDVRNIVFDYTVIGRIIPTSDYKNYTHKQYEIANRIYALLVNYYKLDTSVRDITHKILAAFLNIIMKKDSDERAHIISSLRGACFLYFKEKIEPFKKLARSEPDTVKDMFKDIPTIVLWVMKTYEQSTIDKFRKEFAREGFDKFESAFDAELKNRRISLDKIGQVSSFKEMRDQLCLRPV